MIITYLQYPTKSITLLMLLLQLLCLNNNCNRHGAVKAQQQQQLLAAAGRHLETILCAEKGCQGEKCVTYETPMDICYNGQQLFTNHSEDWGQWDILDTTNSTSSFSRTFFASNNGTCTGKATDTFDDLPFGICVGPFGSPRPWGTFFLFQ